MKKAPVPMEGTWEEILKHGLLFEGKRVRVTVLPSRSGKSGRQVPANAADPETKQFIEEFSASWKGNDLDACLDLVYATRTEASCE